MNPDIPEKFIPRWRQVSATVEVKWDPGEGPSLTSKIPKAAVLETIDHMRMHFASRPFL